MSQDAPQNPSPAPEPQAKSNAPRIRLSEDVVAVIFGLALLLAGLALFSAVDPVSSFAQTASHARTAAPFTTMQEHLRNDRVAVANEKQTTRAAAIKSALGRPKAWRGNPGRAFVISEAEAASRAQKAQDKRRKNAPRLQEAANAALAAEAAAAEERFDDNELNQQAREAISDWRARLTQERNLARKSQPKSFNILNTLALLGLGFTFTLALAVRCTGSAAFAFARGFVFIFALAVAAYTLAAHASLKALGLGYPAWALALGLLIANTIGTPQFIQRAARTELFIKLGLVLLGAEVLLGKALAIGLPGIFVAWVVTPIVLVSTYWFGQRVLKIRSRTLNITISADMSVCGVSAAIATAAACKAKKEELTLAVGLSLVFTAVMMVVMPVAAKALGLSAVVGGAWIGGTLDATGAVAAAGAFLGETALQVAATVKMIQNVLIGVIAFAVAAYFSRTEPSRLVEQTGAAAPSVAAESKAPGTRSVAGELWARFPKFILGLVAASALFSALHATWPLPEAKQALESGVIGSLSKPIRGWLFCFGFVSIGVSTDFRMLRKQLAGGKPLALYVCGQLFNIVITLAMAYLMFEIVFANFFGDL